MTDAQLQAASYVIKRARTARSGLVAAFVHRNANRDGCRVSVCDCSDETTDGKESLWAAAKEDDLRMRRLAGVYNEYADVISICEDLEALGLQ